MRIYAQLLTTRQLPADYERNEQGMINRPCFSQAQGPEVRAREHA